MNNHAKNAISSIYSKKFRRDTLIQKRTAELKIFKLIMTKIGFYRTTLCRDHKVASYYEAALTL